MEEEKVVPAEAAEEQKTEEVVEETPKVEPTAGAEDPVEEPPLVIPPPRKKTAQERIDELTWARRQAEREAQYWKDLAAQKKVQEQPEAPLSDGMPQRPVISHFDSTEAYEDALLQWHDARRTAQTRAEETRRKAEEAAYKFQERAKPLKEQYEDFDEVVENPVFSPAMRAALLNSENGPEIAYFLGRPENSTTASKIRALPVERQIYELGKLEASLLVAKKQKKVPQAPPPINPVGMGTGGEPDPSKMSTAEWMEWDKRRTMERLKKKLGG